MRLIDADALKKDLIETKKDLWKIYDGLSNHIDKQICAGQIGTFQEVILRIKDAPTIEAEPVNHGRWVEYETEETYGAYENKEWYKCSECGKYAHGRCPDDEWYSFPILSDYCPNCGAKMDLEG